MTDENVSKVTVILRHVDKQLAETGNVDIKLSKEYLIKLREIVDPEFKKGWQNIPGLMPMQDTMEDEYYNPESYAVWIRQYIHRRRKDLIYLLVFVSKQDNESVCIKSPNVDRIRVYGN